MAMDSKNSNDDNRLIAWEEVRKEFEGIKHLGISYTLTSNNDGLHDFYAYGTDNEGKAQAKFLNNHPKILIVFLKGLGYNITQEQLRKSPKENNDESKGTLYFSNEKEYQEFVQELYGNPNSERKKQLAQTRCLINKHRDLLNGFESKIKRHVEMKIDKVPWLLEQLMSWTKLVPNDIKHEIVMNKYVFTPMIEQTIKQENVHAAGQYAVKMADDPDKHSPEFHMVADQLQMQVTGSDIFESRGLKPRFIFAISPKTDLYKLLNELYGSQINMDKVLKNDEWFKPGDNARKNGVIDYFCDSYWKIPEMDDYVGDTIRKAFPKSLYDKISITIKKN